MTTGQAIKFAEAAIGKSQIPECNEFYRLAADALRAALNPPDEPLTLEQLRQMDGEPVYIPETNCWVLVTQNPFVPLFTWPDREQCSAYDWYEQVGPVYRCPPEKGGTHG